MPPNVPDPQAVLRGHTGEVQALDFDATERFLVSGDSLGEVRVWDLHDLRPAAIRRLHPLSGGILCLRLFLSAGQQLLGTQGRDGTMHLWACGDLLELPEEPVRSFISDCYSFCRFSVLAPEQPPESELGSRQAHGGEAQQLEDQQQQADEFIASVLRDDAAAPPVGSGDSAGTTTQSQAAVAAAAGGTGGTDSRALPEHCTAGSTSAAPSCSAAAAIWGLHPCLQASREQPPALVALPGGDERTATLVCCACGASLAAFREEAAGKKLGMLMAVQLYCLPAAATEAAAGSAAGRPAAAARAATGNSGPAAPGTVANSSDKDNRLCTEPAAAQATPATAAAAQAPRICLAAGYEDGSLVLWDAAAPDAPLAQRQLCQEPIMALALHPSPCNPSGGACGSAEQAVVVFKLDHSARPAKLSVRHEIELRKQGIGDAAVRPDGKLLVTGGWDGRVWVYKYRSGRALAILKYHTLPVTGLCFAPRSMLLATAARDGTLALWPLYQPDE